MNESDLISRQAAIRFIRDKVSLSMFMKRSVDKADKACMELCDMLDRDLPSAQPTLYGYNIEHLELIARVLQKEGLPPEKVAEALTDIGRIVAIVRDEFEETLRKAVER